MLFFTPKFRPVIGLDIGATAIKIVEIRPAGKRWRLHRCGLAPLPPEVVVDSQIKDAEIVTNTLRDLLRESKITTKQVAVAISGSSVIIKKIPMATMTEMEMEDQISVEAEEHIPFDIEDVYLDFQVLGRSGEQQDVMLVACKKEIIKNYLQVLEAAGLKAHVVDLELFALANAQEHLFQPTNPKERSDETIALVNMGSDVTNICILTNGSPAFTRDLSFGGRQLLEEIQRHYDISHEEALRIQIGESVPEDYLKEVIEPFLEQTHLQIGQSLDFFQSSHADTPIRTIYLSGGNATLPGLSDFLATQTNLPVSVANPFNRLEVGREFLADGLCGKNPARFMVALGLALRGVEK